MSSSIEVGDRRNVFVSISLSMGRMPTFNEYKEAISKTKYKDATDRTLYRDISLFKDFGSKYSVKVVEDNQEAMSIVIGVQGERIKLLEEKNKQIEEILLVQDRWLNKMVEEIKSIRAGEKIIEKIIVPSKEAFFKENHAILQKKYGKHYDETRSHVEIDRMWKDRVK